MQAISASGDSESTSIETIGHAWASYF
jgi:hypothetical protein